MATYIVKRKDKEFRAFTNKKEAVKYIKTIHTKRAQAAPHIDVYDGTNKLGELNIKGEWMNVWG